jgi:hypothetical protein
MKEPNPHAFAVDDIATLAGLPCAKSFSVLATFGEQKWSTLA